MSFQKLEKTKNMAGQLSPVEQAELIAWLGNSLQATLPTAYAEVKQIRNHRKANSVLAKLDEQIKSTPRSGAEIAAMIESGEIDTTAWDDVEITDPVTWLKDLRSKERKQRGLE